MGGVCALYLKDQGSLGKMTLKVQKTINIFKIEPLKKIHGWAITALISCLISLILMNPLPALAKWPTMIFPTDQGTILYKGSTYTIQWSSVLVDPLSIVLCTEESSGYVDCSYLIANSTPNDGSYSWTVPNSLPTGSNYVICAGLIGISVACSDYPFTIRGPDPNATWFIGSWSACTVECGGGTQTRDVHCEDSSGNEVPDSHCSGTKPSSVTACNTDPCIGVNLTDFERVPVFNNNTPNDQSVTVTVSPNPLPAGKSVTLEIVTLSGSGDATFDNGIRSMTVSNTTTVKIRGVVNSSVKNNIKLIAEIDGDQLDEIVFSVRTWPKNFRRVANHCTPLNNRVLEFDYTWDSESGNDNDLIGMGYVIGEWVDYPGNDAIYIFPSPPYGLCSIDDPHIFPANVNDPQFYIDVLYTPDANFHDDHRIPCGNNPVGWSNNFDVVQYYWFHDPVFMDATFNWGNPSSYKILMGPITIYRIVYENSGTWIYRVEKHGCIGEINLLPRGITGILNLLLD
jgi:hypothetical protein